MLVVAAALAGGYYVISTRSEARAATRPPVPDVSLEGMTKNAGPKGGAALDAFPKLVVEIKTGGGTAKKTCGWTMSPIPSSRNLPTR